MTQETSASTVGLVAACMARGLTPEETEAVFEDLKHTPPADSASAIQWQLEEAIARHREVVNLNDILFGDSIKRTER